MLRRSVLAPSGLALCSMLLSPTSARADGDHDGSRKTATPIKHVIVLIGENRSFDNVYGTYEPRRGQSVSNLLSKGIVRENGAPGPRAGLAAQVELKTVPSEYFIHQPASNKSPYATLPAPNTSYLPAIGVTLPEITIDPGDSLAPFDPATFSLAQLHTISPSLPSDALLLLTTGGTGQTICNVSATNTWPTYPPQGCNENDQRIANFLGLPNSVFPLEGTKLPYDSYTGDMVHRFYHMWQQSDCSAANATRDNPSGCLLDLVPYVGIARADGSSSNGMGFYNVLNGDAPVLKRLADEYTMSDNYHQPIMGGTMVQHMMLGTGDVMFWQPYTNQAGVTITQPPAGQLVNPTPSGPDTIGFTADKAWTACDDSAPWAATINSYLATLPWRPDLSPIRCEPGKFFEINNIRPGFDANGQLHDAGITAGSFVPPSSIRTIGDALNEKKISWAYYGGGYNAAVRFANGSTDPIDEMIGTGGDYYCDICNPFQYATSIMGNPAQRQAHIKDATDFFDQLESGHLPAVAYVKPDSFDDGHPATSKVDLLEALIDRIHRDLKANPKLFDETAFFIAFDEDGGYWDSGSFIPLDFFGDGPRIPFVVVSPHARGGKITHSYTDHASVLKFIERNWGLAPLTKRSRDNLPNPRMSHNNPYIPENLPALGDLFDMFDFND
ncbi:MAG TPA: alkaline phosphatase family protein [Polyangia bacterium]|nr:alkaline phosphatase family protein [Polyangia bacterium]